MKVRSFRKPVKCLYVALGSNPCTTIRITEHSRCLALVAHMVPVRPACVFVSFLFSRQSLASRRAQLLGATLRVHLSEEMKAALQALEWPVLRQRATGLNLDEVLEVAARVIVSVHGVRHMAYPDTLWLAWLDCHSQGCLERVRTCFLHLVKLQLSIDATFAQQVCEAVRKPKNAAQRTHR